MAQRRTRRPEPGSRVELLLKVLDRFPARPRIHNPAGLVACIPKAGGS